MPLATVMPIACAWRMNAHRVPTACGAVRCGITGRLVESPDQTMTGQTSRLASGMEGQNTHGYHRS